MTDDIKDAQSSVNDELLTKALSDHRRAFPYKVQSKYRLHSGAGMSLQEYAAIHLKVPDSGNAELDEMIRKSLRNDFAKASINTACSDGAWRVLDFPPVNGRSLMDNCTILAYKIADAMLKEMGE